VVAINSNGTGYGADQAFKSTPATADSNSDGGTDILFRHKITGDVAVWLMNGTTVSSGQIVAQGLDPNWQIMNK